MSIGTCLYCLKKKKLCKAHIIPKFYYKSIRTSKGIPLINNMYEKQRSKDVGDFGYDPNILCHACDKIFGKKLEEYMASLRNNSSIISSNDPNYEYKIPISYRKLKLFLLLVLWRASISKRPMWENIGLSENKSNQIRDYLKKESLVDPYFIPIICILFEHNRIKNPSFIIMPESYRDSNTNYFTFIFGSYMWVFFLEKEDYSPFRSFPLIRDNEILKITKMDMDEIPFLSKVTKEMLYTGIVNKRY